MYNNHDNSDTILQFLNQELDNDGDGGAGNSNDDFNRIFGEINQDTIKKNKEGDNFTINLNN